MSEKNIEIVSNDKIDEISSGTMTKAGRLAMELANEKSKWLWIIYSFQFLQILDLSFFKYPRV